MYINGGCTQVFYDGQQNPFNIEYLDVVPDSTTKMLQGFHGQYFDNISAREIFNIYPKVTVRRQTALGDILMLLPVLDKLKKKYPGVEISAQTSSDFMPFLSEYRGGQKDQPKIILDGTLERDHTGSEESYMHRVDIYGKELCIDTDKVEWKLPYSVNERIEVEYGKLGLDIAPNIVALQAGGSTNLEAVPTSTLKSIAKLLISQGLNVFLFGNVRVESDFPEKMINLTGKTTIFEAWALIRASKFLICFDSGPLWMSHFENKPIICLLGPTRIQERLSKHPLFGTDKVTGIELNKIYGCQSCFEKMEACRGSSACMKIPSALVVKEINTILPNYI